MNEADKHLKSALAAILREKEPLIQALRALTERENAVRALLGEDSPEEETSDADDGQDLTALIEALLSEYDQVSNEQVRIAADKLRVPYKDGRSINAVFQGMKNRGRVIQTPEGGWRHIKTLRDLTSLVEG